MDRNVNVINWFEVSVSDIVRATKFYEEVFAVKLEQMEMMGMKMAFFPQKPMNGKVLGGLVEGPMHKPSAGGTKIYFNGNPDLADALSRVEAAGGHITMPETKIGDDIGYMAFFVDAEDDCIAMHSQG